MIESNLEWGSQPLGERSRLRYGVSITDAFIDWATTERLLREARAKLKAGPQPATGGVRAVKR